MEQVTTKDFNEIWEEEPIVVIDTNVLLDLYRYSSLTTDNIIENFKKILNNIWIPNHVYKEFNTNREKVKKESFNKYKYVKSDVDKIIEKAKTEFINKFSHYGKFKFPKINGLRETVDNRLKELSNELNKFSIEIKDEIEANSKMLRDDFPQIFVQQIREKGNIGDPFSIETMLELYKEGEERYKYCVPPGYMDIVKDKEDHTKTKKFGDLVFWKKLLKKASELDKPFILVTSETKPDWWVLDKDKIIAPRNELIQEFNDFAIRKEGFTMLSLGEFIKHISPINNINSIKAWIEINIEEIVNDFFDTDDWKDRVTSELSGYLVDDPSMNAILRGGSLEDIDEIDFDAPPDFRNVTVDFEDENAVVEGEFEFSGHACFSVYFSGEHSDSIESDIVIRGKFHLSFFIDYENEDEFIDYINYDSPPKRSKLKMRRFFQSNLAVRSV